MAGVKRGASAVLAAVLAVAAITVVGNVSSAAQPEEEFIPLETAAGNGAAQERFAQLIESLEAVGDDVIVDAVWHGSSGEIIVSPGYVPTANRLADQLDADAKITAGNGLPLSDRTEVETTAMKAVAKAHDIVFATRYDPARDALVITVYMNQSDLGPGDLQSIRGSARSATKGSGIDIVVETTTDDPPMSHAAAQGGENYSTGCTGGFIGWKGSGQGIITAKHCTTKPSTYDGVTTGSTYTAGSYDLRFTALSGGTPENKVRVSSSSFRTITSTGTPFAGMDICKYGRATGYTCGKVVAYYGCIYTGGSTYYCGLFYTSKDIAYFGDSGGPWLYGNRAYGITHGGNGQNSFFTGINYIGNVSGVYVKTVS